MFTRQTADTPLQQVQLFYLVQTLLIPSQYQAGEKQFQMKPRISPVFLFRQQPPVLLPMRLKVTISPRDSASLYIRCTGSGEACESDHKRPEILIHIPLYDLMNASQKRDHRKVQKEYPQHTCHIQFSVDSVSFHSLPPSNTMFSSSSFAMISAGSFSITSFSSLISFFYFHIRDSYKKHVICHRCDIRTSDSQIYLKL